MLANERLPVALRARYQGIKVLNCTLDGGTATVWLQSGRIDYYRVRNDVIPDPEREGIKIRRQKFALTRSLQGGLEPKRFGLDYPRPKPQKQWPSQPFKMDYQPN